MAKLFSKISHKGFILWKKKNRKNLSIDAKLIYFYLLSNPLTSHYGIFDFQEEYLIGSGVTLENAKKSFNELINNGLVNYDDEEEVILMKDVVRNITLKNVNEAKGLANYLKDIDSDLTVDFLDIIKEIDFPDSIRDFIASINLNRTKKSKVVNREVPKTEFTPINDPVEENTITFKPEKKPEKKITREMLIKRYEEELKRQEEKRKEEEDFLNYVNSTNENTSVIVDEVMSEITITEDDKPETITEKNTEITVKKEMSEEEAFFNNDFFSNNQNNKIKKFETEIKDSLRLNSEKIYDYYRKKIKSGDRTSATFSISKALLEYPVSDLIQAVDNYKFEQQKLNITEMKFYKAPHNFFSNEDKYKDFIGYDANAEYMKKQFFKEIDEIKNGIMMTKEHRINRLKRAKDDYIDYITESDIQKAKQIIMGE